jgi:integrase
MKVASRANTTHIYVRDGIVYVYGRVGKKSRRYSTGRIATDENIAWAKANWRIILTEKIAAQRLTQRIKETNAFQATAQSSQIGYDCAFTQNIPSSAQYLSVNAPALTSHNARMPLNLNGSTPTLADYGVKAIALSAHSRKPSSNSKYEYILKKRIIPSLGSLRLDEIRSSHIRQWQNSLIDEALSASTIKQYRCVLSLTLKDAIAEEIIDRNPLSMIKPPKAQNKEKKPFSLEEICSLLNQSNRLKSDRQWFKEFLTFSFFTGLRTGETFALEWKHIDFDNKIIYVRQTISEGILGEPKTKSSVRDIEMLPFVEEALRKQYGRTGKSNSFVFQNQRKSVFKSFSHTEKRIWKPLLEQCGLEHRELYSTRHTFASIMLSEGEEPMWVSAMLGHKNLAITLGVYAKYIPRPHIQRAAFLDKYQSDIMRSKLETPGLFEADFQSKNKRYGQKTVVARKIAY